MILVGVTDELGPIFDGPVSEVALRASPVRQERLMVYYAVHVSAIFPQKTSLQLHSANQI